MRAQRPPGNPAASSFSENKHRCRDRKKGIGDMFALKLHQELIDLVGTAESADEWAAANCRGESGGLTELFFSDQIPDIIQAKEICSTCSLIEPCLEGALERREPWGVWGGQLFLNGRILTQKRKRGRPPKNPAPGIQLTA
jgi:WhiB family transcriptional regulator, redox-sensing transcriptional regulator